jgi:cytochrome c-type biogenesis protein CcmH/NrfG
MSTANRVLPALTALALGGCIHTPWAAGRIHRAEEQVLETPDSTAAWMALGDAFRRAHDPRRARAAYQKALVLDPSLTSAQHAISEIQPRRRVGRLERKALRDPGNDELWGDAADAVFEAGDADKALRFYLHALRIDPADQEWISRVTELGGQDAMLDMYRQLMQAHPDNDELMGDYGDLLASLGRDDEACLAWQRAQQIDTADTEWGDKVAGCVSGGKADPGTADSLVSALQARIQQSPEDDELRGTLGDTLLGAGRADEAAAAYRTALELDPGDSEWLDKVVALTGEPKLTILLDLTTRFPTSDELWGNLGDLYLDLGQREEARAAYRKAAALDPSDSEWQQKLAMFGTKEDGKPPTPAPPIPEVRP